MNVNRLPLVSVLLPSLWRFDQLLKAIKSFSDTATQPKSIEMLVRLHIEDHESLKRVTEINYLLSKFDPASMVTFGPSKPKDAGNEWLWNDLRSIANGRWQQFWSDDMTIEGEGWDSQLAEITEDSVVVHPQFHRLNHSIYFEDRRGPVPFIRNHALQQFTLVPDVQVSEDLVIRQGFKIVFLKGITVNHQRNEQDDTLNKIPYAP